MPTPSTVWLWRQERADLFERIAHAREVGHDAIAAECLEIADHQQIGEIAIKRDTKDGPQIEVRREDMLGHRKLQIDTRLKLLAKWDRRYADRPSKDDEEADKDTKVIVSGGLPDA